MTSDGRASDVVALCVHTVEGKLAVLVNGSRGCSRDDDPISATSLPARYVNRLVRGGTGISFIGRCKNIEKETNHGLENRDFACNN